jgi:hypothetical protein
VNVSSIYISEIRNKDQARDSLQDRPLNHPDWYIPCEYHQQQATCAIRQHDYVRVLCACGDVKLYAFATGYIFAQALNLPTNNIHNVK